MAAAWEPYEEVERDEPREGKGQIVRAICKLDAEAINKVFNIMKGQRMRMDWVGQGKEGY